MHRQDETMDQFSDQTVPSDEQPEKIDFTVDSAGNVSPGTRERAARVAERTQPSHNPFRNAGRP